VQQHRRCFEPIDAAACAWAFGAVCCAPNLTLRAIVAIGWSEFSLLAEMLGAGGRSAAGRARCSDGWRQIVACKGVNAQKPDRGDGVHRNR
jgi:hypothetical protein